MEMSTKRFQEVRKEENRKRRMETVEGLIRSSERLSENEKKSLGGGDLEVFKNFQDILTRMQKGGK